jgi:hypothetical protein
VPQSELPLLLPWDRHITMAHVELERVRRARVEAEADLLSEMKERVRELRMKERVQELMLRSSTSFLNCTQHCVRLEHKNQTSATFQTKSSVICLTKVIFPIRTSDRIALHHIGRRAARPLDTENRRDEGVAV